MKSFSTILASFLLLAVSASAAVVERADSDKSDWKYAVGWDGVTLPSTAIGDTVPTNETSTESHLTKRTVGGVFICTETGWGGRCGYAVQPLNKCINLGPDWANQISSFGPDKCTTCWLYGPRGCTVDGVIVSNPAQLPLWNIEYPGSSTGGLDSTKPWNDRVASFRCSQQC